MTPEEQQDRLAALLHEIGAGCIDAEDVADDDYHRQQAARLIAAHVRVGPDEGLRAVWDAGMAVSAKPPEDSIECPVCGGKGYLVNVTAAIEEATADGHTLVAVEDDEVREVIHQLAREALASRDGFVKHGWLMWTMPHEAEVRAVLGSAE